uniref:Uncharacterized protein ORF96 n=1 Tax=Moneuplotes minuta TaxID=74792 RepID=D1LDN8_9SPIT|nr:hypothetical protein [Moneuplotes minuta]
MFNFYLDNLCILVLRNVIFYFDYASVIFSLGEFFAIVVIFFSFLLFRLLLLNRLFRFTLTASTDFSLPVPHDTNVTEYTLLGALYSVRIFTPRSIV